MTQQKMTKTRTAESDMKRMATQPTPLARRAEHPILRLQRTIGNHAVQRMLNPQNASLEGSPGYEGELSPDVSVSDNVRSGLNSPGESLDAETREFMEGKFGYDFSGVRVHTNGSAADSSSAIDANAYTVGQDIVFGAGKYSPANAEGKKLIAHELAHVVQRGNDGLASDGTAQNRLTMSEPSDASELEAEDAASQIVQDGLAGQDSDAVYSTPMTAATQNPSATVQRQGPDDVDPLGPTSYPPRDTELPGGGTLTDPVIPKAPAVPSTLRSPTWEGPPVVDPVPEIPIVSPGTPGTPTPFPEPIPAGPVTLPSAGVGAETGAVAGEGAAEGGGALAGLGAEAALPVTAAAAAGAGLGYGMAKVADSSYTKTGAFGTNQDTGQNQSAMDWGANWGTDWDKAHNNGQPSIIGGTLAGAGGIVGGIGGAAYGAANWLADKL